MAWWNFGKKKRQPKEPSAVKNKLALDEKRSAVSSPNQPASQNLSKPPTDPAANPLDLGATPYELQREGTPPILSDAPVHTYPSSPRSPKSPKSHKRNISDASSSQGRSDPVPQTPPQYPAQIQPQGLSQVVEQEPDHEPPEELISEPAQEAPSGLALQDVHVEPTLDEPERLISQDPAEPVQTAPNEPLLELPRDFPREKSRSPPKTPARPPRRDSIEDITALPAAPRTLERSPHLRPVPDSDANIRAGSSANQRALSKKKSSRRPKDNAREKEIREMSSPMQEAKRAGAQSPDLFRSDSKRMRDDLKKPLDPASTASFPRPGSGRSSVTGVSDIHRLAVGFVDILAPRPRVRYSFSGPYEGTLFRSSSRLESRKEMASIPRSTLEENKRIDELADEMGTSSLREIMERDQRRREKKRKGEQDRARRRLERLAARGEKEAQAKLNDLPPPIPPIPRDTGTDAAGPSGVARESPGDIHPALRDNAAVEDPADTTNLAVDPFKDPEDHPDEQLWVQPEADAAVPTVEKSPFEEQPDEQLWVQPEEQPNEQLWVQPEASTAVPTAEKSPFEDPPTELVEDVGHSQEDRALPQGLVESPEGPVEVSPQDSLQVSPVDKTEPDIFPQTAPETAPEPVPETIPETIPDTLPDTVPETLPETTDLRSQNVQDAPPASGEVQRRISEPGGRKSGGLAALFRRSFIGKRDSVDSSTEAASGRPLSTASRESMSRRGPVENNHERTYRRSSSGVPVRTMSKFKENLDASGEPEDASEPVPPLPSGEGTVAAETAIEGEELKSEVPPTDETEPQSLGSVDAEGSWLSGRPQKRSSQQISIGRSSLVQQPALSTSMEEIKTPATEAYFTPTEESPVQFPPIGSPEFGPEAGQSSASPLEETGGQVVSRTPKLVQTEPRVQSTAGLLQTVGDDDEAAEAGSSSGDDHVEVYQVEEAVAAESVTRKASHARQISAGSARLFQVSSKRDSQQDPISET